MEEYRKGESVGYTHGYSAACAAATLAVNSLRVPEAPVALQGIESCGAVSPEAGREPGSAQPVRESDVGSNPTRSTNSSKKCGAELRILRVLASRYPARLTIAQWATLANMKRTGGTWSTYLSRLRTAGYLDESEKPLFTVTKAGLAAIGGKAPRPQSPEEIIAMWKDAVGSGPARILDELIRSRGRWVSRDDLARRVEMTASGGTFSTYLSRLVSNELVERFFGSFRVSESLWK